MQVFITGVSKGLGKVLTELFLTNGDEVIGIGRSNTIKHKNFRFIQCDLEQASEVQHLKLPRLKNEVVLINNAGIIGSIKRVSEQDVSDIISVIHVNTIAPMLLCQKFLKEIPVETKLSIVNISSGAATRAIPSWASYCASKAALEIFSETIYLEEKEKGRNIKVYSVSPGVLDTSMQENIRNSSEESFSSVNLFKELKQTGQLQTPCEIALKINELLQEPYSGKVIHSLR